MVFRCIFKKRNKKHIVPYCVYKLFAFLNSSSEYVFGFLLKLSICLPNSLESNSSSIFSRSACLNAFDKEILWEAQYLLKSFASSLFILTNVIAT